MSNWYTTQEEVKITPEWRLLINATRPRGIRIVHVCGRLTYINKDNINKIECKKCHQVLNKYWYPKILNSLILHEIANLDIKI